MNVRAFWARLKKRIGSQPGFGSFLSKHKTIIVPGVLIFLVAILIAATIFETVSRLSSDDIVPNVPDAHASVARHPLTGEALDRPYDALPQVFGVMVENSADAWPLSGLDQAFLVIEAPVEGDIPRFISFYSEESEVEEVGPVRSARPYYLDWNDELDGVYVHVGGAPEALETIRTDYAEYDINEFWQSEYFWRENGTRYAPHNTYTDSELLKATLDELVIPTPSYEPMLFKDADPIPAEVRSYSAHIDWSAGYLYDVAWEYERETNAYIRKQGSAFMTMRDGARIQAENVVIIETDIRTVDDVGRKHIRTLGEGSAILLQDGRRIEATWKKNSSDGRLKFYGTDGEELALIPGKTWIEVVSDLDIVSEQIVF